MNLPKLINRVEARRVYDEWHIVYLGTNEPAVWTTGLRIDYDIRHAKGKVVHRVARVNAATAKEQPVFTNPMLILKPYRSPHEQ